MQGLDLPLFAGKSLYTVYTCNRPSKLRGMVTQPVGVPPFVVIAFSNSCSPPNLAERYILTLNLEYLYEGGQRCNRFLFPTYPSF